MRDRKMLDRWHSGTEGRHNQRCLTGELGRPLNRSSAFSSLHLNKLQGAGY